MTSAAAKENAILIVDDEASLRNTFRIFLKREGYETVIGVGSFEEAVQQVTERMFDLIICDIVLEGQSGIDLLKRFRRLGIACPVVIVTGYPHVETASEAVRLGAFDYLPKPVEKEALIKTARLAIQQYHLELEKKEAEQAREGYRRFLETVFTSVSDAILTVDADLQFLQVNEAAEQLFEKIHRKYRDWHSQSLDEFCRNTDLEPLPLMVRRVLDSGKEETDHRLECRVGEVYKVFSCCISLLESSVERRGGCVLVIRDMSCKEVCNSHERTRFHRLIGASPAMLNVYMMIENIGKVDTSVLITGASGTGKELVVHALHQESSRSSRPLIMVDCTAIPDNLMESELFGHKKGSFTGAEENRSGRILQAIGGTLFLDEIGDISMTMQLRLLRFLQEKSFYPVGRDREVHVDVRVIAATNADLKEKVRQGSFREDLYYRLLIIDINLPPLKDRHGDIPLLADHFIEYYAKKVNKSITGISQQAMEMMCAYDWPGNVRQLEHTIERACVLCPDSTISSQHLPAEICGALPQDSHLEAISAAPQMNDQQSSDSRVRRFILSEQDQEASKQIIAALEKTGGNKAKAARRLNMDRSTLYRKIRELHIDLDLFAF